MLSLDNTLIKGHALSDQWDVLTDVTEAYYSLKTGEIEKHVCRVCLRYGDPNRKWSIFGFNTVSFVDRSAASLLEIAIRSTAELNASIGPLAAIRIEEDRYVDDLSTTSGTSGEVARFMGKEGLQTEFQQDGSIPQILSKGSRRLKVMVFSEESNAEKIKTLGSKVLGVCWNPTTSILVYH